MNKSAILALGLLSASPLIARPARADLVGVAGVLQAAAPPSSAVKGAAKNDLAAMIFQESSGVAAGDNGLAVDIASPGTYTGGGPAPDPGMIAAGTVLRSYLLHSDPVSPIVRYRGTVTFGTPVLGVEILTASLLGTDARFGHAGTAYDSDVSRGLEGPSAPATQDFITLSGDRRMIAFDFRTGTSVDDIRVFTAVPEPSSLALAGVGLLALATAGRRGLARTRRD